MSHGRIDELYERRSQLHYDLATCEGMGWRDDERHSQVSAAIIAVAAEIEELEHKLGINK